MPETRWFSRKISARSSVRVKSLNYFLKTVEQSSAEELSNRNTRKNGSQFYYTSSKAYIKWLSLSKSQMWQNILKKHHTHLILSMQELYCKKSWLTTVLLRNQVFWEVAISLHKQFLMFQQIGMSSSQRSVPLLAPSPLQSFQMSGTIYPTT